MRDYKEILLILNLYPFLYSKWNFLGKLIFINGFLYHGSKIVIPNNTNLIRKWDVLCNMLGVLYVNFKTSWQPATSIFTLLAIISWRLNHHYFNNNKLVHICFVQNPLCICSFYR